MADKMTRAQALAMAIEVVTDTEAKEILGKIKASIEKKNTSPKSKKVTEAQTYLRNEIVRVLTEAQKPLAVSEILGLIDKDNAPADAKFSTSSVTANIGTMLQNGKTPNPDGIIVRSMDSKTAKFALAEVEDTEEVDEVEVEE